MKTKFLTIATIFTLALGTVTATYANDHNINQVTTTLTNVGQINKIEIRGNVQLFVSDGTADEVKVYNNYYSESALVQNKNGVLRISSYTPEKLVVWVTANDLRAISAYDNAQVKSFGKLSKIDLAVDLYNHSSAQLNLDAFNATISVNDHAKADLTGSVNEYTLLHDQSATVNQSNLSAARVNDKVTNLPAAPAQNNNELAIL
ncbi:GIN domain-containing protein [Mucilaginibacter segetis]|uniref:DUF2807 domain-containing protein n=1 Tax=Mucilaginibacter segetis TaxID=2793071 RepID=A0A934PU68_9SPHI|nr:DUF2807 domain-containing protein [Mucilaginibacter segetis]MBK0380914.1 DUF2807 domain-containing protein [Mucilaginibacter segetis]